ncbi:MAG: 23S rRNA (uridine(2552)-2'-O)-methyltransferase RlmE [Candidatus Nitrotoga sp.]|nr:23S rRNA (uridine(2552)-2'-O)-methyltransferase RlmE [Candidatus Nitrotoga sp.]MBP0117278.1 23S rRNA (uridine(2552)-2'-O)-methyltransferase RlmE [Candidatus Nitrotoga sp.]MBP0122966.1 23S rRNA (uridine(2552)-2'-O)-methyltransferase RlmE [Candidatus Nitrotoga sp.]MBP0125569.1 23S rRNA (uridine(2552)-2'-O)-methyltransferase RlmE [Candidatus Nitrotoga sp.]
MKRSKTSKQWMHEHVSDQYVRRAQQDGYRSRAAYKLLEIDERDHLLKRDMIVVDLGASPGGWSQVATAKVGERGKIIAVDLLPLCPIRGVEFVLGDFREEEVLIKIENSLNGSKIGLVISDMSPNISGIDIIDQACAMYLAELALDFSSTHLEPSGSFLVKVFQGRGFEEYIKLMRNCFSRVVTRKPDASRGRSNELYLLGTGKFVSGV